MYRKLFVGLLIAVVAGGLWWKYRHSPAQRTEVPKPPEEETIKVTHDTNGNVVVQIPDEMQGNVGITVAKPASAQFSPEVKSYGKVVDPAPLATALAELLASRTTLDYSRRELERMKVLKSQNNASERAFQAAEEAFVRDQSSVGLIPVKIRPIWGGKIAEEFSALVRSDTKDRNDDTLASLAESRAVLVRLDLPPGDQVRTERIRSARLVPLAQQDSPVEAAFFDVAPNVDAQTQSHGFFFLVSSNNAGLLPGAAVTAFIQITDQPISGVFVPSRAVVRTEGSAWVYVMGANSESFTRTQISLDHPVDQGWFVSTNLTSNNYLVVSGAQSILSQETKPAGAPD